MFKNSLRIGHVRGMRDRRSERRIKPSLEHLDARIALSGASAVMHPAYIHIPTGSPTHNQFAVIRPVVATPSPSYILKGGHPGHGVADWQANR
ncbi:MAG: hypothetical protein ACHRXM_18305 [Isosphaerales bacterium]